MKHPSIRELFDYWNERRGARAMPERADIEPAAIRRLLADTFILSSDRTASYPFRIAGTRVCALFGREVKGDSFLHLFWPSARLSVCELLAIVTLEPVGVVGSASELGMAEREGYLELLLLPLGHGGRGTARILGALVPSDPIDWVARRVRAPLTLGSYRFVNFDIAAPGPAPMLAERRGRPRLVVYEGGRR
jgi:hypothetical protein